jgi:hypothetical protein
MVWVGVRLELKCTAAGLGRAAGGGGVGGLGVAGEGWGGLVTGDGFHGRVGEAWGWLGVAGEG